jgi:hypothetical protein
MNRTRKDKIDKAADETPRRKKNPAEELYSPDPRWQEAQEETKFWDEEIEAEDWTSKD